MKVLQEINLQINNSNIILKQGTNEYKNPYSPQSNNIVRTLICNYENKFIDKASVSKYAILQTQGNCYICGLNCFDLDNNKEINSFEFDHIYPASKFNVLGYGNAGIACSNCNSSKNDKDPIEYYKIRKTNGLPIYFNKLTDFKTFIKENTKIYKTIYPNIYKLRKEYNTDEDFLESINYLTQYLTLNNYYSNKSKEWEGMPWENIFQNANDFIENKTLSEWTKADRKGTLSYISNYIERNNKNYHELLFNNSNFNKFIKSIIKDVNECSSYKTEKIKKQRINRILHGVEALSHSLGYSYNRSNFISRK